MDPQALAGQISQLDQSYNPTSTYNAITTQLGIPDARTRVQALQSNLVNTQNAINAVDPNVAARTSGSLVTEAQRGRLVNMERAPLTTTAGVQSQDLNQANNNLNTLTGQANTQVNLAAANYKTQRQGLSERLTAAISAQDKAQAQANTDRANAQAQANADRAFNAQQAQQKVVNNQNATRIASKTTKASSGNSTPNNFSMGKYTNGNNFFKDSSGNVASLGQYLDATGGNAKSLLDILRGGSTYDKAIYAQVKNITNPATLKQSVINLDKGNYYGLK